MNKTTTTRIERSYQESTEDDFLFAPELYHKKYCFGYASFFRRGNVRVEEESRLTEKHNACPKFIRTCRGKWFGFEFLSYRGKAVRSGMQGPWALYRCKHGIGSVGLVEQIRS